MYSLPILIELEFFGCMKGHSYARILPIHFLSRPSPTVILPMDVRIYVFQVVPQGLVFHPEILRDFGHQERGRRMQMVGHSDLGKVICDAEDFSSVSTMYEPESSFT